MKKKFLLLPLLLWAVTIMAEASQTSVPAMIVYGTDGNRQVVQLDDTDITDLIVLQNGQSLSVDIPETQVNSIRSITFAMVTANEVATAMESTKEPIIHGVEKVVRDGQVIIRLQMHSGTIVEYDIQGNQILNY